MHGSANRAECAFGVATGAYVGSHGVHRLLHGAENHHWGDFVTQAFVSRVVDDADDFDIGGGSRIAAHPDAVPDGATFGEVASGERLVDERDARRVGCVLHGEV